MRRLRIVVVIVFFAMLLIAGLAATQQTPKTLRFTKRQLMVNPYESATVADLNRDGQLDIVYGAFWFAGPDFVPLAPPSRPRFSITPGTACLPRSRVTPSPPAAKTFPLAASSISPTSTATAAPISLHQASLGSGSCSTRVTGRIAASSGAGHQHGPIVSAGPASRGTAVLLRASTK